MSGSILTQGLGLFGSSGFVLTQGLGSGDGLLGGKAYSYQTPYQKLEARKEAIEIKESIDQAAIERDALEETLQKASKSKKQAEKQRKIELKIKQLESETLRLLATLQTLEALMIQWDEEDAILALLLSTPF